MDETTSTSPVLSKDLEAALEDVRQIRSVMEKVRLSHPVREVFRPLFLMGFWGAPFFAVHGVLAQWIYDSKTPVLGFSSTTSLWILSLWAMGFFSLAKHLLFRKSARSGGHDPVQFLKRILLIEGYGRIVFAMVFLMAFSITFAIQAGRAEHAVGFLMMGAGSIFLLAPLALPIPEISKAGVFGLLGGGLSLFLFPGYPFYKFALLMGGWNLIIGWVGLRLPKFGKHDE